MHRTYIALIVMKVFCCAVLCDLTAHAPLRTPRMLCCCMTACWGGGGYRVRGWGFGSGDVTSVGHRGRWVAPQRPHGRAPIGEGAYRLQNLNITPRQAMTTSRVEVVITVNGGRQKLHILICSSA